jgi:NAD(P)-dependent dehydrogenase (short-subunit alcohol dehydrogenase family)
MSQKILITGASKGFGLLTSKKLLADGHQLAATMRNADSGNKEVAEELRSLGAKTYELDVTNNDSVNTSVNQAIEDLGGLDAVINNAGIGVMGQQEAFTPEDWQRVFDVNLFGVQRVNRAVLPHMREKGAGLLMHVSSLLGRMVLPFYGPYNATKWALEAMADNYRVELSQLGIETVIVEPGGFGTDFAGALLFPSDQERKASYGPMANAPDEALKNFETMLTGDNAPDPQMVADAISEILAMPHGQRPFRTTVDGLGMDQPIKPYNAASDEMMKALYGNMGMDGLLKVKTS